MHRYPVAVLAILGLVCVLVFAAGTLRAGDGTVMMGHDGFIRAQVVQDSVPMRPPQTAPIIPRTRAGGDSESLHSPSESFTGFPVVIAGDTLFHVYRHIGSFGPYERARRVSSVIETLINNPHYRNIPVTTRDEIGGTEIVCGDMVIMAITNEDARIFGGLRQEIAVSRVRIIQDVIDRERARRSPRAMVLGLLFTAAATIGLGIAWRLATYLSNRLEDRLTGRHVLMFGPVAAQAAHEEQHADRVIAGVRTLRILVQLGLVYVYVTIVTGFFYATQGLHVSLDRQLQGILEWGGPRFVNFLPELFIIATIATVTYIILQLLRLFFVSMSRGSFRWPGFQPDWAQPMYRLVSIVVLLTALILVWPHLPGAGSPAFNGIAIFAGIMLAIGSAVMVINGVAGLIIGFTVPYKTGEHVRLAGTTGDVVSWTLLVTRLRTKKNVEVTIPNAVVLASHIINFSRPGRHRHLILSTQVCVSYDVAWSQVHNLLLAAARYTPQVLRDPAPFVIQVRLNPDGAVYELNVYIDNPTASHLIYSALHQQIREQFAEAGVPLHGAIYISEDGGVREPLEDYLPGAIGTPRHLHVFPPLRRMFKRERPVPPAQEDVPE